jgi:hypothetical protein
MSAVQIIDHEPRKVNTNLKKIKYVLDLAYSGTSTGSHEGPTEPRTKKKGKA